MAVVGSDCAVCGFAGTTLMNRKLSPLFALCLFLGCNRAAVDADRGSGAAPPDPATAVAPSPSSSFTNRFGMTFRLVSVEPRPADAPASGKFGIAFPTESYYLGQSEVTGEQFEAFRRVAAERDLGKPSAERKYYSLPGEWKYAYNLGVELSALDPDYEYALPTREQWAFACMNGFDQDCPHREIESPPFRAKRPNKFGIEGFLNNDIECGNLPGLHFGLARLTTHAAPPDCCCADYAYGNPDGDDGLNEMINCRYVAKPRGNSPNRSSTTSSSSARSTSKTR